MFLKIYIVALPIYLVIDAIWLFLISRNFYKDQIGLLMKTNVNFTAAIITYLLFTVGLVLFVISPAIIRQSWLQAVLAGALFGLIVYATYDLTNLATLKDWPILVSVIDALWGMVVSSLVSVITYFIFTKFL